MTWIPIEDPIEEYVTRHNHGVRTGDFSRLMELFCPDATMRFTGIPAGPFRGVGEIADAFRAGPPDNELVVSDIERSADRGRALYGWNGHDGRVEGELRFAFQDGLIAALEVVRFGSVKSGPDRIDRTEQDARF